MSCQQYESWAMGGLSEAEFSSHRKSCTDCESAYQADKLFMETAADLNASISIPDQWPAIENEIHKIDNRTKKIKWYGYPLIAAAALLIIITLLVPHSQPIDISQERILDQQALQYALNAEDDYLKALESLELRANDRLRDTDEQLASLYHQKIELIDQQINRCRNALEQNPANAHIRRYLLAALESKQTTLSEIVLSN